MTTDYRVVVLELNDVVPRIQPELPNLYVGVSLRTSHDLANGLNKGRFRPKWAHHQVTRTRDDLSFPFLMDFDRAVKLRNALLTTLRARGCTVNRATTAYRTYVINLHNPKLKEPGKGYLYVGQTSKTPEARLVEHLTGAVSTQGRNLASRVVKKHGVDLNYDLMNDRIYLTQKQALNAEQRLAERLRDQGYVVEGGR
jgi:hypothetical protein